MTHRFPHLKFTFTDLPAGWSEFQSNGAALPPRTVETLRKECDAALFGAVSSPITKVRGYSSPIVALRKELDLYANVRPVKGKMLSQKGEKVGVDLCIVRENTEDLYVKEEKQYPAANGDGMVTEAIKRISERASRRISTMAGHIALRRHKIRDASKNTSQHPVPKVTVTHKSNVLSLTDGLFRTIAHQTLSRSPFSDPPALPVTIDDQIVDSLAYKLFLQPAVYDVIVAPNLYGDILSDAAAALVGSLGLVPSANVGDHFVIGEPCHGSAPDIAGKGISNPIAAIRSAGLMLEFLGEEEAAREVDRAVEEWEEDGQGARTPDMGGTGTTEGVSEEILKRIG